MAISDEKFKAYLDHIQRMLDKMDKILVKYPDIQEKVKEYSVRQQEEAQGYLYDKATSVPLVVPAGQKVPETQNVAIQRILLSSGAITREQFEAALGVSYDGDFNDDDEIDVPFSVDEDFEQSRFASYADIEVPNVETKSVDKASAVQKEPTQVASDNSDNSGASEVQDDK